MCSNVKGPRDDLTMWSKSEEEKYHMISFICEIMIQMNLFTKETHRLQKQSYGYQKGNVVGGGGGRDKLEVWD